MQRGKYVGKRLRQLAKQKGMNQPALEKATGIGHSTMSGYWSDRLRLGDENGPKIAKALGVAVDDLGLDQPSDPPDRVTDRDLDVQRLWIRVAKLERQVDALIAESELLKRVRREAG